MRFVVAAFCRWRHSTLVGQNVVVGQRKCISLTCKSSSPIRPAPRFGRLTRSSMRRPLLPRTPKRGEGARGVSASVPSSIPSRSPRGPLLSKSSNAFRSRRSWRPSTLAWTPSPIAFRSLRLEVGRPPSRGESLGAASLTVEERQRRECSDKKEIFFFLS